MGALYIDRRDAELDYRDGQLTIREPASAPRGVPLSGLDRVVIAGNSLIHTRLLTRLAEQGTGVLLLEGRGTRRHAWVAAQTHGDARRRLGQYRLCTSASLALRWSRLLVHARAVSLLHLYEEALEKRPDKRHDLLAAQRFIQSKLGNVRKADDLASLRGLEGAIASAHFSAYGSLFSKELGFTGRNRRPPRDPVNAALSLGYTLTHADAVRVCLLAGLDPLLGVLHEPSHGRESLACDLNELARASIEHLVWRLFAEKHLRHENFERHAGGVSMNKTARQTFYTLFEQQAQPVRRRLRTAAAAIARHCNRLASETQ